MVVKIGEAKFRVCFDSGAARSLIRTSFARQVRKHAAEKAKERALVLKEVRKHNEEIKLRRPGKGKGKGKDKSNQSQVTCWVCGKSGHYGKDCYWNKDNSGGGSSGGGAGRGGKGKGDKGTGKGKNGQKGKGNGKGEKGKKGMHVWR